MSRARPCSKAAGPPSARPRPIAMSRKPVPPNWSRWRRSRPPSGRRQAPPSCASSWMRRRWLLSLKLSPLELGRGERERHIPGGQVEPRTWYGARPGRSPPQEEERMKIRPLHDRLLVERLEEKEVKKGGIIIPDTAKEKPQEAKVIAVGNGKVTDEGKKIPLDVKAGDKILFGKYSGSEVKIDDKEYLIMREDDVLAILE